MSAYGSYVTGNPLPGDINGYTPIGLYYVDVARADIVSTSAMIAEANNGISNGLSLSVTNGDGSTSNVTDASTLTSSQLHQAVDSMAGVAGVNAVTLAYDGTGVTESVVVEGQSQQGLVKVQYTGNIFTGNPLSGSLGTDGSGGSTNIPDTVFHTYTYNGITFTTLPQLDSTQQAMAGQIIQYGLDHYFSNDQINTVINLAFNESSLGDNESNPSNSNVVGVFQYDSRAGSWFNAQNSDMNVYSDTDQIQAMYDDALYFQGRYYSGQVEGTIPQSITLEDYIEVKHHAGQNTSDFSGTAATSAIIGYHLTSSQLDFSFTRPGI